MTIPTCPLCHSKAEVFISIKGKHYFECNLCGGIFLDNNYYPDYQKEKERYEEHNNDVNDLGYQNFVNPIVSNVLKDFSAEHSGLDFGAGTSPVISKLLNDKDYKIKQYDPFFHNHPDLLNISYDYIACCEVVEHFYKPDEEFKLLHNLLKTNGKLYLMTSVYRPNIDFKLWYYKNDPTHVFFYTETTFEYIRRNYDFSGLRIDNNLIVLSK